MFISLLAARYNRRVVSQRAAAVFNSADRAKRWMGETNTWLDGKSPNYLINIGRGQEVLDYLNRVEYC